MKEREMNYRLAARRAVHNLAEGPVTAVEQLKSGVFKRNSDVFTRHAFEQLAALRTELREEVSSYLSSGTIEPAGLVRLLAENPDDEIKAAEKELRSACKLVSKRRAKHALSARSDASTAPPPTAPPHPVAVQVDCLELHVVDRVAPALVPAGIPRFDADLLGGLKDSPISTSRLPKFDAPSSNISHRSTPSLTPTPSATQQHEAMLDELAKKMTDELIGDSSFLRILRSGTGDITQPILQQLRNIVSDEVPCSTASPSDLPIVPSFPVRAATPKRHALPVHNESVQVDTSQSDAPVSEKSHAGHISSSLLSSDMSAGQILPKREHIRRRTLVVGADGSVCAVSPLRPRVAESPTTHNRQHSPIASLSARQLAQREEWEEEPGTSRREDTLDHISPLPT